MDSKKFKVRSFRGYYETDDIKDTIIQGKEMILDIITDGFDTTHWHVLIFDNENGCLMGSIECPSLGWWKINVNSKYFALCMGL
ncbi:MAG: hypothetical protein IJH64_06660 [Oscillospiraceae bacterium]|nr:hypothetical protein [Oscillospiraceae bacterium]